MNGKESYKHWNERLKGNNNSDNDKRGIIKAWHELVHTGTRTNLSHA